MGEAQLPQKQSPSGASCWSTLVLGRTGLLNLCPNICIRVRTEGNEWDGFEAARYRS